MKKFCLIGLLVASVWLIQPNRSEAGFELSLSLGGNYSLLVNNPKASERVGLNTEFMLSYRVWFTSFDLGITYDFLKKHVQARPGLRLHLGWLYFRLGFPMSFSHVKNPDDMFNLGLLGGVGIQIRVKKILFKLEGNISPYFIKVDERGLLLPAEVRLGIGYRF